MIPCHKGVLYEPHDARTERYPAHDLIGASEPVVLPLANHIFVPPTGWVDQQLSESCVGHAIMQIVHIRQGAMGVSVHKRITPSSMDIYYRGRASRNGWQNVIDIGSNPVACLECLRDPMGIVRYEDFPFDPMAVDDPPDPALYRLSVEPAWFGYHWILDDGQDRLATLDALLRSGHPVAVALTVDRGLVRWTPADGPWRFNGPVIGGHYVPLVSVDSNGDYWAAGSWGSGYGLGGMHCIARSEIASSRTSYLVTPVLDLGKVKP